MTRMTRLQIVFLGLMAVPAAALAQTATQAPATAPAAAAIQGGPAKGEKIFTQCKACHVADAETNKVGPYLKGVIGRKVASVPNYNYSQAMKDFAATHPVWTEEQFLTYIENPRKVVPGTKMAFPGLKKPEDRANILAYLKTKM